MKNKSTMQTWLHFPCRAAIVVLMATVFTASVEALPTKRPLPPGIISNNPDWMLLRDHEDALALYLIPRRYSVVENVLRPYGDQEANCAAVEEYDKATLDLIGARQKHAEVRKSLATRLAKMSSNQERLLSIQVDSVLKKKEIEELLKQEDSLPSEKKVKLQADLADADRWITTFNQQLENIEKFKKVADNEQAEALKQISTLEASLEKFTDRMARPSGQVQIRLRLPEDPDSTAVRLALNLDNKYKLQLARPVGLSFSPSTQEELGYRETSNRAPINTFKPDWNIKPVTPSGAWFGTSELPVNVEWAVIENEISFEHMVSLAVFCAHKKSAEPTRLLTALSLRYDFPIWKSPVKGSSTREIVSYTLQLKPSAWEVVKDLAAVEEVLRSKELDQGDPALYYSSGTIEKMTSPVTFSFILSEKKESTK